MSKNTAPGMCAALYSALASRPVCGRYHEASAIRTSGASRCSASHSVETRGEESLIAQTEAPAARLRAQAMVGPEDRAPAEIPDRTVWRGSACRNHRAWSQSHVRARDRAQGGSRLRY